MKRYHLNLSGKAWRQLQRNWDLQPSLYLAWQTLVTGAVLSAAERAQLAEISRRGAVLPKQAVFIIGYWRSGTTLLHELLALDPQFCAPSTHACMNPHAFLLEPAAAATQMCRPMDDMMINPNSPQECEFALLSLGARTPYEALLVPRTLEKSLALVDPERLTDEERAILSTKLQYFLTAICSAAPQKVPLLKSPPHSCRIPLLLSLFPDAKFILMFRDPFCVFESAVRMWMRMCERCGLTETPAEEMFRNAILATRPTFEDVMVAGLARIAPGRFAEIRYEDLAADTEAVLRRLYQNLSLGDFTQVRQHLAAELVRRRDYRPVNQQPDGLGRDRLLAEWPAVLANHTTGYSHFVSSAPRRI